MTSSHVSLSDCFHQSWTEPLKVAGNSFSRRWWMLCLGLWAKEHHADLLDLRD
ncbi:MAG TPA: hypothetical protein VL134_08980 [Leptolyngbya sp.]|nr:hypothetical protein [Leptolyngbya sp.]